MASLLEGLTYGAGDALLGLNPVDDSAESVARVLHRFEEVKQKHQIPTLTCVLAVSYTHLDVYKRQIEMHLKDEAVYSDRRWLVYMLDQIIGNAVKYRGENPTLTFGADISSACGTEFWVEDNGTGIAQAELPYIFDKGYIGSCQRNGGYRSTGMGLYLSLIHI